MTTFPRGPARHAEPHVPPRPGLQWKEQTHRWIRPDDGTHTGPRPGKTDQGEAVSGKAPVPSSAHKEAIARVMSAPAVRAVLGDANGGRSRDGISDAFQAALNTEFRNRKKPKPPKLAVRA